MAAFDPNVHTIDPDTGFQIDKETGHMVGIETKPTGLMKEVLDFPKWVAADISHIVRKVVAGAPDHISAPLFSDVHVDRITGAVTVLVKDAEEEALALAPKAEPKPAEEKKEG